MLELSFVLIAALVLPFGGRLQALQAPDATEPPATQHAVLTLAGRGVQIYACRKAGEAYQWEFVAPSARLFTSGAAGEHEVATHGEGPSWTYQDGSSIHGKVVAKAAAPKAGAVPWLLLQAVAPTGSGVLSAVEMVRRSDTEGGVAPTEGCSAAHLGDESRVPYTATYTFYSSKQR